MERQPKHPVPEALWGATPGLRPYGLEPGLGPVPGSVPISVAIITLDEEPRLEACLASVAFAADVVVVDAMSSDSTAALARRLGARVFERPWPGFAAQRNYSLAQCRFDWVLSLDADERVSLGLAESLARLMGAGPAEAAYRVAEMNLYFGRWLRHGGLYPGHHVSFFDRRRRAYEGGGSDVHEDVSGGRSGLVEGHILHLAYPDFRLALKKLNHYTDLEARGRFRRGGRASVLSMLRRPVGRFFCNYFLKRGFLDGVPGFLYCCLTALYAFSYTVKIWELGRRDPPGGRGVRAARRRPAQPSPESRLGPQQPVPAPLKFGPAASSSGPST